MAVCGAGVLGVLVGFTVGVVLMARLWCEAQAMLDAQREALERRAAEGGKDG